ncbi:MAG: hypothetical protein Fur0032_11710 [Terrimicrobiaceae bacterium]
MIVFMALACPLSAEPPGVISYQGRLVGPGGQPVANVPHSIAVRIYREPSGGTPVWGPQVIEGVPTLDGRFAIQIGPVDSHVTDPPGGRPLSVVFQEPDAYLSISVDGAEEILPRQKLVAVPYAMAAGDADRAERAAISESLIKKLADALNPPGTIIAYAGAVSDSGNLVEPVPGYLLCNGAVVDGTAEGGKYSALVSALGSAWGNGGNTSNAQIVNLPDFRGVFLRGWNGAATDGFADPDRGGRVARRNQGATGNSVGSFQMDEFKSHSHPFNRHIRLADPGFAGGGNGRPYEDFPKSDNVLATSAVGGSETRGKNAYVAYLIKY